MNRSVKDRGAAPAPEITVARSRCRAGKGAGVQFIDVHNGRLSLRICPTRGMGVLSGRSGALRLGWDAPAGEVVNPRWVDLPSKNGSGWIDGFTEFVVRCGLSNVGRPGWDAGGAAGASPQPQKLTLHGRIANTPASTVRVHRHGSNAVSVEGVVEETSSDGALLKMHSRLWTRAGLRGFQIRDCVRNVGPGPAEFQMLYHCNFGPPLLEKGSRFRAPIRALGGIDAHASRQRQTFAEFEGPCVDFREQVFVCWLRGDSKGRTLIALENAAGTSAVSMSFSLLDLPCMSLWKQTGSLSEMYVAGLEPGTSFPNHRSFERKHGRVRVLAVGEEWRSVLEFRVHSGVVAVERLRARIDRLQGAQPPQMLSTRAFWSL